MLNRNESSDCLEGICTLIRKLKYDSKFPSNSAPTGLGWKCTKLLEKHISRMVDNSLHTENVFAHLTRSALYSIMSFLYTKQQESTALAHSGSL